VAYDQHGIAEVVVNLLTKKPTTKLREVAEFLCVDRHTVERALRERFGKSFKAIQAEQLRAVAERRMRERPQESIKEIAAALGYDHSQSFSRKWRRITGSGPSQTRSRLVR
jgi:AraC-like DNA-binding protein